ncbi:hypothetical protein [Haloechinothrix sp. LS1_15]|uniref:hypothetical protein n=1 Tax=Haloechinothrix sp. LS1_15 TaxID=2652248 RepID=UPI00294546D2|nr:hypothetical protein [Haloechinothrix sp. LS1_15]MDV6012180.1 hypothetical protein [Haloechinothrix sp. LS1_15]
MRPYLLFDAHCGECSSIARTVREIAGDRVTPRSMHDPELRPLVERARPDGPDEPLLLETNGDEVRIRSGFGMRLRLLRLLGPGRAFRLAARLSSTGTGATGHVPDALGRRAALSRAAGVALASVGVLAGFRFGTATASASTSGNLTPVTDPAVLDRLRDTAAARSAATSFGTPRWDAVYRGDGPAGPFYLLSHAGNTFTAIGDPAAGADPLGLSFRVRRRLGHLRVDWLHPEGIELLHSDFDGDGNADHTRPAQQEEDGFERFVDFMICFGRCAAPQAPACGPDCIACGFDFGLNQPCLACAGCVASIGLGCASICQDELS